MPRLPRIVALRVVAGSALICASLYGTSCAPAPGPTAVQLQTATIRYDAGLLQSSLDAIERWHRDNETGLPPLLARGLDAQSIERKLAAIDCAVTDEMTALWSWRNGADIGAVPLVWYHDLLSVDEAIAEYRQLRITPFINWHPDYVPLFSFEGEWYGAYCSGTEAGPVQHLFIEDEPRVTHANLTTFVAGMAESMRNGAIRWHDGAMHEDVRAVARIHKRMNPGYPFPYYVPEDG